MMKKFFARRFGRYLFIMLLPTLLVFAVSVFLSNRNLDKELRLQAENTLTGMNRNLELVVSTAIYQNELLTANSGILLGMKRLLSGGEFMDYSDAIYLRTIQSMLQTIANAYDYIDSVYLYLDGYERMMTSDLGIASLEGFEDGSWMEFYEAMQDEKNYVCRRVNQGSRYSRPKEVLSFYQRMLLLDGVIVMNVDMNRYLEMISELVGKDWVELYFLNQNGELLLSWNSGREGTGEWIAGADPAELEKSQGRWIPLNGEEYLFHMTENEQYHMKLIALIPAGMKQEQMRKLAGMFLAVFLANLGLVAFLAYTTTERNFRQIRYMIQVFNDAERGIYPEGPKKSMEDEYDIIMNNIIYIFLNTVQLNGELQERRYETERAKMAALQMQINPHFLQNTLQSMEFEIQRLEGSGGNTARVLQNLSDILKYSLEDPMSMVPLREEIGYLKQYVEIQKYRFGETFIVYYEIEECLYDAMVFRLLLQPLLENSILHGLRGQNKTGYIKLRAYQREGRLHIHIVDSGIGMTKAEIAALQRRVQQKKYRHIGMANVNSRLCLKYGEESRLTIWSKKGLGCAVMFSIPWEKMGDCIFSDPVLK